MGIAVGFSHITGFIIKIAFRIQLPPNDYGIFAYFVGFYPFFLLLGHIYLEYPIVASVSENPNDSEENDQKKSQLLSVTAITASSSAFLYFLWTGFGTGQWILSSFFSFVMFTAAFSNVTLAFSRGRGVFQPTGYAWLTTGLLRGGLLALFTTGILLSASLETASIVFALPWLTWPLIIMYYREWIRPTIPSRSFVKPFVSNGTWSLLVGLAIQIPLSVSLLFLKDSYGFTEVGDFDIALISYSVFSIIIAGAVYVTNAKARELPAFPDFARRVLFWLCSLMLLGFISAMIFSHPLESIVSNLLQQIGMPVSIYWSVIILLTVAVPVRIAMEIIVAYLQGRGVFKPVGIITIICAISGLPFLFLLINQTALIGGALGIGIINIVTLLILLIYGFRKF